MTDPCGDTPEESSASEVPYGRSDGSLGALGRAPLLVPGRGDVLGTATRALADVLRIAVGPYTRADPALLAC
ncbi:MAG: hypothetical protein ACJ72W_12820 [Actinoallomurus sp.]